MLPILTPTSSAWPPPYPSLAYRAAIRKTRLRTTLLIPLQTLYFDILRGRAELRNPKDHLPALLRDSLSSTSGLSVCLDVGFYWWTKLLAWMVFCDMFTNGKTCRIPVRSRKAALFKLTRPNHVTTSPDKTGHSAYSPAPPSSLFLNTLHEETPAVSLDCVPYRHLESYIRSLQASLVPGSFLMLGLTLRPANCSFWSKATILTALPFLPRRFLQSRPPQKPLAQRTTTPLVASILSVLQLLTSGPNPLTVEVVRNVSREYADFLHQTVDELESGPDVRVAFVRKWGMQGWIEERLCLAWEAALVDAGMLENWAIVVCKLE
ncbi:hypothetical protein LXA43DRAFT_883502 [Ganoderma leucocontextum]|nr:hypothetical protein LXA43DRAFT_883502 [Ganoderma leucocontextum]